MQPAEAIKPERFGRYVLLDRIGEGGMAEVYRAILPGPEGFKRTFVIKKILPKLNQSPKFVEMFVREARIMALLSHPGIVHVSDFGSVDGHYFLAMEYLRGHDVLAVIRRLRDMKRPFPIPVATFIAHEVASCLGYAHALSGPDGQLLDIVHRDVSPSNIMCLREGGVKLLDFGIASAASESGVEQTDQGTFKGKLRYIAPERLRNERFDGRSDIYSLGVVLWEMLVCRRLFRGGNDAEIWKLILEMPIPAPSSARPDIPAILDAITLRMLERDPDKRYQTGRVLADDLEEAMRETKWQSRHLPHLLVDLFGSGTHSSQLAMSRVSPDLLANLDDPSAAGSRTPVLNMERRSSWRSWRLWGVLLAAATAAGLALGFGLDAKQSRPPAPTVVPAVAAPPVAKIPPPAGPAAVAPVETPPAVAPPPNEPAAAKPARAKKSAKLRARVDDGAIRGGRSIDPFAEAARRGRP
jgi:serine/threonine protein kinase